MRFTLNLVVEIKETLEGPIFRGSIFFSGIIKEAKYELKASGISGEVSSTLSCMIGRCMLWCFVLLDSSINKTSEFPLVVECHGHLFSELSLERFL